MYMPNEEYSETTVVMFSEDTEISVYALAEVCSVPPLHAHDTSVR